MPPGLPGSSGSGPSTACSWPHSPLQPNSDPSAVGSLAGLANRLAYLRDTLGMSNFLIGGGVNPVGPASGCPTDFAAIRPPLGRLSDLSALAKKGRKKGFNLILELDLSQADPAWSDKPDDFIKSPWPGKSSRDSKLAWSNEQLHLPRSTCNSLNVSSPSVRSRLGAALTAWLDAGVSGFLLNNVAFMAPTVADSPPIPNSDWFASDPRASSV
ncbi:hypothetical protein BOX15_Mlig022767g2 [Macrostomum lignano]|uniref:Glycosyl hydrolase family 13 catalytic domain-containing protein n=1 Tax=Macrostomum lignano TaxID=282301 RepID=A0A267E153_9PLAT|nr:hypothetical protein BOX15_Mlig022767g2 [Macrostomum lignano]